jgi:hypothetical protein
MTAAALAPTAPNKAAASETAAFVNVALINATFLASIDMRPSASTSVFLKIASVEKLASSAVPEDCKSRKAF